MYFYFYVHLDKAKIATLGRLAASSNVIKCWQKLSFERRKEHNLSCWKLARQPKSFTCTKFHLAGREEKIRRFLEEKLDVFLSIWQPCKTTKRMHKSTFVLFYISKGIVTGNIHRSLWFGNKPFCHISKGVKEFRVLSNKGIKTVGHWLSFWSIWFLQKLKVRGPFYRADLSPW